MFVARHDEGFGLFLGALFGAVAGLTLRKAVHTVARKAALEVLAEHQPTVLVPRTAPSVPEPVVQPAPVAGAAAVSPSAEPVSETDWRVDMPIRVPKDAFAEVHSSVPSEFHDTHSGTLPADKAPQQPEFPTVQTPDFVSRAVGAARDWLLGGNTIVRMGVLVLFVGLAFLAKYAMDNAMLPPELRLAAIGAAGIALFVFGWRMVPPRSAASRVAAPPGGDVALGRPGGDLLPRQPDRRGYALTLQGAGVGVLYLTVFAAFRLYQFLPAGAAFVVLALVCAFSTAIALLQNAMPMAFIGFAGAFAAPILLSTGQGDHVGLFSYYLLLGGAIAAVAWLKAWRALNLLGFFATFGVATAWGVLKYRPDQLATTEPFLIAFFVLYLAASLMYATRHGLQPKQAVDATLIFGLPLVAFGLQAGLVRDIEYATAFSSLAMGAIYLGLGWWALKRQDAGVGQWLAECFVALGMGFVTLAVPLALDARWTTAVWAAEGAAVYWMGKRQDRWLARLAGLALQGLAALSFLQSFDTVQLSTWPIANPAFIGAVLLALSALAIAHWTRPPDAAPDVPPPTPFVALEHGLSPVLFWVGFLWWQFALGHEIERGAFNADGLWTTALGSTLQSYLEMLGWLGSAWLAHRFALPTRPRPWTVAATPAWFSLPIMGLVALQGVTGLGHVFQAWGWLVWPLALGLHFVTLKSLDQLAPQRWWSWVHSGGVWLVVLLVGNIVVWAVQQAQLQGTAWASVISLVASVVVLMVLAQPALYAPQGRLRTGWPLDRFAYAYLWRAAAPLAVFVAWGALLVAVLSDGNAKPLPYVPLLNPTDITVALALAACALWRTRVRQGGIAGVPESIHGARWTLVLAGLGFVAINTVWLRAVHHWAGVPWDADQLFASFLVQTGYSILWTLLAMALMLVAHRRHTRALWSGGAALLGLTVAKLFLVDLSNRGGSERIVAFIAVGVLMLVVGYFAPIPPIAAPAPEDKETT
ncbi:DUF2339 domain-containing protein [Rhodoferax sp. AJA081-3]|uniref:DUF2339 domain-containing protein n=1 Tax=Rhodoferax sp. AJA081-3 TaxID=2752316 RepID=UPI001AE0B435|nr:DUF2339 domain-containing protein [Rhodoferax sp. AJA081-3]QTN27951.1 DUF2339 domain-containing protein [Rhodoferax sp. AJA081-3]